MLYKQNFFAALLLFLFCASLAHAAPLPSAPKVNATGYLLIDYDSGQILAEHNAKARLEPASLTKIMTAYTVFRELANNQIGLEDEVLISEKAWRTGGSRMFVEVDTRVKLEELIKGMVIQSGNDASVALAEHVAGSEETFAAMMNELAVQLGMESTNFTNSTGWPDDNHYTTPYDIARVAIATIRDYPQYYPWYAEREMTYNNIVQRNRNRLLWKDDSVDGMKTGHTEAAGYCLVTSAKRGNMRLIAVVMGTESEKARATESLKLLNYGFRFFETHRLYSAGESLETTRVYKGDRERVQLGTARDIYVTVPRGQYVNLSPRLNVTDNLVAPLQKDRAYGQLTVTLDGETLVSEPVVALQNIGEGGFLHNAADSVRLWLK